MLIVFKIPELFLPWFSLGVWLTKYSQRF